MKLSLLTALALLSSVTAISQPEAAPGLDERQLLSGLFPGKTSSTKPTASPTGTGTQTTTTASKSIKGFFLPTAYGFITKPLIPQLFPPKPTATGNDSSTSQDADRNPFLLNSPNHRGNWFPGYNINTDTSTKWPNTFKTNYYDFRIQNTTLSPDGTPKQMIVINGQYPGPLLEGNWGDWFEVRVTNELQHNGTGIHWHGFRQLNNNPADGTPGITECPIAPGASKTYRFRATGYGSTWYHTHFSSQYGDGVIGPVIVHGPASANYDIDLGQVMLNDYYPLTIFQEDWFAQRFGPPQASNYLVNGHNVKVDGSAGQRTQFKFTPGKKHLMRFMNNGVDISFKVQLDGHSFLIIAADNTPIVPYKTKEFSINIGQRFDVIVTADQPVSNYYLRTIPAPQCSRNSNNGLGTANAYVSYNGAPNTLPANPGNVTIINQGCIDEPIGSLVPIVPGPVDSTGFAAEFDTLPVELRGATLATGENVFLWYLNGISQNIDWSYPTIETVADNRTIATAQNSSTYFPDSYNIISLPTEGKWTFWVIQNQFFVPHPMHLHGHDFALLGQGLGTFSPSANLGDLNFKNPPRRDVANLIASGWTVIAFKTDNPGSWLMHCHIAWHVGEGLSLQFLELPSKIPGQYGSEINGRDFQNNCKAWDAYYGGPQDVYGKTDSGLKKRAAEALELVERGVEKAVEGAREYLVRRKFWGSKKH